VSPHGNSHPVCSSITIELGKQPGRREPHFPAIAQIHI